MIHGLNAAYQAGCRCFECRVAHGEWQVEYRRRRAEAPLKVDAAKTRKVLARLKAAGLTDREITRRAGLERCCVGRIRSGRRANVYRDTHDALLGVTIRKGETL